MILTRFIELLLSILGFIVGAISGAVLSKVLGIFQGHFEIIVPAIFMGVLGASIGVFD